MASRIASMFYVLDCKQKSNYNSLGHTFSLSTLPWKKRKSADPAKSALEESMSL